MIHSGGRGNFKVTEKRKKKSQKREQTKIEGNWQWLKTRKSHLWEKSKETSWQGWKMLVLICHPISSSWATGLFPQLQHKRQLAEWVGDTFIEKSWGLKELTHLAKNKQPFKPNVLVISRLSLDSTLPTLLHQNTRRCLSRACPVVWTLVLLRIIIW